jgi:DMSO/TMAO reductase YedYZ molybdopterin-dependent catalytic subunit
MRRRDMLTGLAAGALALPAAAAERQYWMSPQLPDGTRAEARVRSLPGKQPLICLSEQPPNYEAPIGAFQSAITQNSEFFVRYHLAGIPSMNDLGTWSVAVGGDASEREITLGLQDLSRNFPQSEIAAVCQCSGNRRGLSDPHVAGVEWGYGAMGNAVWRGPRLRDVLASAGVKPDAVEVWLGGADGPVLAATPDFQKSLPLHKALADEVIIATHMNGQALPHLNGFPARVVVPGWTATYWMKHVTAIQLSSRPLANFWMEKAYRVPAGMFPVEQPFPSQDHRESWPITEMVVNSVIGSPIEGATVPRSGFAIEGVAWDRGHGIKQVEVSVDGGRRWERAALGDDLGRFAFRAFGFQARGLPPGPCVVSARATSNAGEAQSERLRWNPAGYHNNMPQQITVTVA